MLHNSKNNKMLYGYYTPLLLVDNNNEPIKKPAKKVTFSDDVEVFEIEPRGEANAEQSPPLENSSLLKNAYQFICRHKCKVFLASAVAIAAISLYSCDLQAPTVLSSLAAPFEKLTGCLTSVCQNTLNLKNALQAKDTTQTLALLDKSLPHRTNLAFGGIMSHQIAHRFMEALAEKPLPEQRSILHTAFSQRPDFFNINSFDAPFPNPRADSFFEDLVIKTIHEEGNFQEALNLDKLIKLWPEQISQIFSKAFSSKTQEGDRIAVELAQSGRLPSDHIFFRKYHYEPKDQLEKYDENVQRAKDLGILEKVVGPGFSDY